MHVRGAFPAPRLSCAALIYVGSYLWPAPDGGSELVLMPSAMVVPRRADDELLYTRRGDDRQVVLSGWGS